RALLPLLGILPFQGNPGGITQGSIFGVEMFPRGFDRFRILLAVEGFQLLTILASAALVIVKTRRTSRFVADVGHAIKRRLRPPTADGKVHCAVLWIDHQVSQSQRLAGDEFFELATVSGVVRI